MIFALDTNVLFYAIDRQQPDKRRIAADIMVRARDCDCILPTQVLGEFIAAVRRKNLEAYAEAVELAADWSQLFRIADTRSQHVLAGASLARRHKLQFWDSLILAVAGAAGAEILLTEDLQDGAMIGGVLLLDPFDPANRERLDALLAP